jgi:hypothetical protein
MRTRLVKLLYGAQEVLTAEANLLNPYLEVGGARKSDEIAPSGP